MISAFQLLPKVLAIVEQAGSGDFAALHGGDHGRAPRPTPSPVTAADEAR